PRVVSEVCGSNTCVARCQSIQHDKIVTPPAAQLYLARLDVRVTALDKSNRASAGLKDAACGDNKLLSLQAASFSPALARLLLSSAVTLTSSRARYSWAAGGVTILSC